MGPHLQIIRNSMRLTRETTFPDGHSALMLVCARLRHMESSRWGTVPYYDESLLLSGVSTHNSFEAQLAVLVAERHKLGDKADELANASYMLFMDRVKGIIYESSYISLNKKLAEELDSIKKRIATLEKEIKMIEDRSQQAATKIETIKQYKHFHALTRELVLQFIYKIEIERRNHDTKKSTRENIHWNI